MDQLLWGTVGKIFFCCHCSKHDLFEPHLCSPVFAEKELFDLTKKLLAVNPKIIFAISTEKDTRYHNYVLVLKILKKAGAKRIHVGK
jgi:uncharacterized protein (UPF0262 family)